MLLASPAPRRSAAAVALVLAGLAGAALSGCAAGTTAAPPARSTSAAASRAPTPSSPAAVPTARPLSTHAPAQTPRPTPKPVPKPTPTPTQHSVARPVPTVTRAPVATARATRPAPAPLLVEHLIGVGNAQQVISVVASGYGTSYATLQAFSRTAAGWVRTFGPWQVRIGTNGFAPAGAKREGDYRTPTGAYGFSFFYGVLANPGVRYAYRQVTSHAIVWDDDPASPAYNTWMNETASGVAAAGRSPEPMDNVPVYDYGAVIDYNAARTPGLGSAIFLHQTDGNSTAGCVALPQSELLDLLRWLNPAAAPRIIMGTAAAVTD